MTNWMREPLHKHYAQSLSVDNMLYDSETDHQRIKVFENGTFGRILTLDDVVQTTEGDNFVYHEMLTHVPILAHGAAKRVLIIGGGDGGMAREVLRHTSVNHVTMVEIDAGVVEFSKKYLPTLSQGAFDDPRLELVIKDGAVFMRETEQTYDVIIVDSTDPIGPGEVLFTDTFYGHAQRALTENGILVTQNGVPFMQGDEQVSHWLHCTFVRLHVKRLLHVSLHIFDHFRVHNHSPFNGFVRCTRFERKISCCSATSTLFCAWHQKNYSSLVEGLPPSMV